MSFSAPFPSISSVSTSTLISFAYYPTRPAHPDVVIPASHLSRSSSSSSLDISRDFTPPSSPPSSPRSLVSTLPTVAPLLRDTFLHRHLFHQHSPLSSMLRYGRHVACFNLYPATTHDLAVNDLLWASARNGEYDPVIGNPLLRYNVLALAFPEKLFRFLASVTHAELRSRIVDFLLMIAEGEDSEVLSAMQQQLEPELWNDLSERIRSESESEDENESKGDRKREIISDGEDARAKSDIELLLGLCFLCPWKVEVYASFVTPMDMSVAMSDLPCDEKRPHTNGLHGHRQTQTRLVRSMGRRPLGGFAIIRPVADFSGNVLSNKKVSFWAQFQHWRMYRRAVVHGCNVHPAVVSENLLSQYASGAIHDTVKRACTMMACVKQHERDSEEDQREKTRGTHYHMLEGIPRELVDRYIVGFLLLAGSK